MTDRRPPLDARGSSHLPSLISICLLVTTLGSAAAAPPASDDLWQGIAARRIPGEKTSIASFRLDKEALEAVLGRAPKEGEELLGESRTILTVPMPDGSLARFRIEESPVFEPELAAQHPEIRSFRGQGVDLETATIRFDWTPLGFHALILASGLSVTVHPETRDAGADYVSTQIHDAKAVFECGVIDDGRIGGEPAQRLQVATGSQLRTYRIAISTTGEFTQDVGGGSVAGALAALNTLLNGINAIYERDLAVHINLIAGLTPVIFTNPATDPYTNGDTNAMIGQVAATLGANIPDANYDFGHVIGTNSGGLAGVGVICDNTPDGGGPRKAAGVSAASAPAGSAGDINLISHEIGHQFGAPHSQNSNCNRSPLNAIETGSGVTIMSYNGVCPPNNTTPIGELRFHAWSLGLMNAYIATQTCQVSTATGNGVPTVNAGPDRTIPVNTPFTLTAAGSDPDAGDLPNLTYAWEQVDPGKLNAGATDFPNPPYQDQPGDPATTTRPILTALATSASPSRTFPRLAYILNDANDPPDQVNGLFTAEELPRVARTLNFRVTIRDNRAGAGGTNDDLVTLTVSGTSGPFQVTAPNGGGTWTVGSPANVTWNVNNTASAPVSCASVKITLSTDGGMTFPIVLAAGTPNDGSESITVPNGLNTAAARVKVEAVGNIFFDVSNANFTINAGAGCPFVAGILPGAGNAGASITLTGSGFSGVTSVRFSNNVAAVFNVVNDATITATVPVGAITGPITLARAGCPDVPTSDFTVCPSPPLLAQVDDGSGEMFWSGRYFVNRLTPSAYPATLTQVVMQLNSTFGIPAGSAMTVLFGANPGGTTNLGGVSLQAMAGTSNPDGQFKAFDVAPLTITSGDFVVGFAVATGDFPGFTDTSAPAGRSYSSTDGTFGSSTMSDNLLVRARYHTSCGTATACPTVSNPSPASGAVGSSVTIPGTNLTGVTAVTFTNNVPAAFTVDNVAQITATVPAGAVTGPITVTKPGCPAVQTGTFTVTAPGTAHACVTPGTAIPDNNPTGITSDLTVSESLSITGLTVTVNIQHSFIGDLIVELRRGATIVRLHNRTGMGADNIVGTYPTTLTVDGPGALADFHGQNSSGTWTLFVSDNEGADLGSLVEWCLDITGTPVAACPTVTNLSPASGAVGSTVTITGTSFTGVTGVSFTNGVAASFTVVNATTITATVPAGAVSGPITVAKPACTATQTASFTVTVSANACATPGTAIPDNTPAGITSNLNVGGSFTVTGLTVTVNIQHSFIGDLIVELRHLTTTVRLHNRTGGSAANIVGTYPTTLTVDGPGTLADFIGHSTDGAWTLFVSDNEGADLGTLTQWCLDIQGTPATTAVEPPPAEAVSFRIAPNPTMDESSIRFSMPRAGLARIRVVDLAGRLVRRLQDGWVAAGPREFRWDGRDDHGARVGSGIYFVAIDGVGLRARGKLVVSR